MEIKVPELAESITEGTVASWLKQPGDQVEKGEAIVELETDKVNIEVPSDEAGILSEVMAAEGDTVRVGETIAIITAGGEAAQPTEAAPAPESKRNTCCRRTEKRTTGSRRSNRSDVTRRSSNRFTGCPENGT